MAVSDHITHVRLANSFRKFLVIKELMQLFETHGKRVNNLHVLRLYCYWTAAQISLQLIAVIINVST
jgi:hypothetical protein